MSDTSPTLYTIGHSNHEFPAFAELLRQHDIAVVVDVRSSPYSRFHSQFNREPLAAALAGAGIDYMFLGEELGARRAEPQCYVENRVRYDLVGQLPLFLQGLSRLREEVARRRVALMCAEKDPLTCHRTILVCRNLRSELTILHILEDGRLESHEEAEDRLLKRLKLPAGDMFDSKETFIEEAYNRQGDKMAFSYAAEEQGQP